MENRTTGCTVRQFFVCNNRVYKTPAVSRLIECVLLADILCILIVLSWFGYGRIQFLRLIDKVVFITTVTIFCTGPILGTGKEYGSDKGKTLRYRRDTRREDNNFPVIFDGSCFCCSLMCSTFRAFCGRIERNLKCPIIMGTLA
jgi:hypothetical protein